jgi:hypothetical protein
MTADSGVRRGIVHAIHLLVLVSRAHAQRPPGARSVLCGCAQVFLPVVSARYTAVTGTQR